MSVGLMDADMARYTLVPFNLEIMKLSAYYKKKGEIVILSPDFSPERNTQFIYRQDYAGEYPANLTNIENVEYGGLAFSNNKYAPLPLEVERMKPDTSIYARQKTTWTDTKRSGATTMFNQLSRAEHCRLSLDGATVWSDYYKQFRLLSKARLVMLHDYDLAAIDKSYETVQTILKHARQDGIPTRIGMKYPVRVTSGEELMRWTELAPAANFYSIEYDGVMDMYHFIQFVSTCRSATVFNQLDYYVTASSSSENDFVKNHLREIFRQVIISRSYRVFFTLKYEDNFFFDKRWEDVIKLLNYYHNSYKSESVWKYYAMINTDTLFDFAASTSQQPHAYYKGEVMTRQEIRQVFKFVQNAYPDLFKDFYECNLNTIGEEYDSI